MLRLALAMLLLLPGVAHAEKAILAGGCFWCVESDFEGVKGVTGVVSGFTGGKTANPTYEQVTAGGTGHYEAAEITFDPGRISYPEILRLFFRSVDPTDGGGQFCDRGDSYRTAIFAKGAAQKAVAEAGKALGARIATKVLKVGAFWPADAYHQGYYKQSKVIVTRFGPRKKSTAYKLYRDACGRDQRVLDLWGAEAAFAR